MLIKIKSTLILPWKKQHTNNIYTVHIRGIDDFLLDGIERFNKWDNQYFITLPKNEVHFGCFWCVKNLSSTDMWSNKINVCQIKRIADILLERKKK